MDPIEIVNQLNELYSSAFSQLITITALMIGFGGIILPIVLQLIQKRSIKNERSSLEVQIKELFLSYQQEADVKIADQFKIEKEKIAKAVNCETAKARGLSFALQGNGLLGAKKYRDATCSYIDALWNLLDGNDEQNYRGALTNLIKFTMPYLNSTDFEEEEEIERKSNKLIAHLEEINVNERFTSDIISLQKAINKGKKTPPGPSRVSAPK